MCEIQYVVPIIVLLLFLKSYFPFMQLSVHEQPDVDGHILVMKGM